MTKRVILAFILSAFLLCSFFTYIIVKFPYIGLGVEVTQNKQYEILNVYENGAGKQLGIIEGDIIVSINGLSPLDYYSVKKYKNVEKADNIIIQRDGNFLNYDLGEQYYRNQLFFHMIFPLISFILSFFFSIFLFKKRRTEKVTFVLIVLFQLYAISQFAGAASARTEPLGQVLAIAILLLIPMLLLHFFFSYFQKFKIRLISIRTLKMLYIANISIILSTSLLLFFPISNNFYSISKLAVLLMFVVNVMSCIIFFGKGYWKFRRSLYNSLFKIINMGIFISFSPFILLYALPTIVLNRAFISGEVAFLFTYFLPFTFVYLVTAKRLLDIDFYIKRVYYFSLFSIIPSIVLTIVCVNIIKDFTIMTAGQIFTIIYLVFIILFYAKEELDYRFRNKLFSEKYNFQSSIYQFVQFLSTEKNIKLIEHHYIQECKSVLGIKNIALLEYDRDKQVLSYKNGDQWDFHMNQLKSQLSEYDGRFYIGDVETIESALYLIVAENNRKALVLVLGEKRNFTSINLGEKEWLKAITYYMNVSYQNLQLIDDLIEELENIRTKENAPDWVLKMLFTLEEKERKRLSSDLHDTALQEQLLLYQKFNSILNDYHFEPLVLKELSTINDGLLDVIYELRETCNELMPPFLKEIGIIDSVENLIKKVQLRSNLVIDFFVAADFPIPLQDDVVIVLYRVVQELMNNAEKHSNASNIHISLTYHCGRVILNYKDNGDGIDEEKLTLFNGQNGIYGIKERIRSVDGIIDFYSSNNSGLETLIEIPVIQIEQKLVKQ